MLIFVLSYNDNLLVDELLIGAMNSIASHTNISTINFQWDKFLAQLMIHEKLYGFFNSNISGTSLIQFISFFTIGLNISHTLI